MWSRSSSGSAADRTTVIQWPSYVMSSGDTVTSCPVSLFTRCDFMWLVGGSVKDEVDETSSRTEEDLRVGGFQEVPQV